MQNDKIRPFTIDIPSDVLSDLQQRLKNTRWSYQIEGTGWDAGTDVDYLKDLLNYWQNAYDWRKHERALNQFTHYFAAMEEPELLAEDIRTWFRRFRDGRDQSLTPSG